MASLAAEERVEQYPLFIDYGQRARDRELKACIRGLKRLGVRTPAVADLKGFGAIVRSGLTDPVLDVVEQAFTPGRNALFILIAAAYAVQVGADAVAIGLLDERRRLFPDQSCAFLVSAEAFLALALGRDIKILAPLMHMSKADVVALARSKGIDKTYSCHRGGDHPCGECIACREFGGVEEE
jgi:7-cyano-7-deazaguanine synthase